MTGYPLDKDATLADAAPPRIAPNLHKWGPQTWLITFVAIQAFLPQPINVNPISRLATIAASVEEHRLAIDTYVLRYGWTEDWALAPNGHYYSNKAPGPALAAVPFAWIAEALFGSERERAARDARRWQLAALLSFALSLAFQVVPYTLVCRQWLMWMQRQGYATAQVHFAAVGLLFGTTTAVFANIFFGHVLAAALLLEAILAIVCRRPGAAVFWLGLAPFFDYAASLPAVALGLALLWEARRQSWRPMLVGLVLPATLWCSYHVLCFGSVVGVASRFGNPKFVDLPASGGSLWGIVHGLPVPATIAQLIWGTSRGLLWTQPWILWVLCTCFRRTKCGEGDRVRRFTAIAFLAGFWLNAAFGNWGGGESSGPRYLIPVLPGLALWGAAVVRENEWWAWLLLGVSVAAQLILLASSPYAWPAMGLWSFVWRHGISIPRLLIETAVLACTAVALRSHAGSARLRSGTV